jgi:tetratricopeptide (TPR) repeat protein
MKTQYRFLILIAGALAFYGCSNDFLDVTNENELSSDNFFSKIENFDLALNGTYDAVKNLDLFGQTYYVQTLLALPHESDYWNAQNRNEVNSADGNVYIAWRGWYRVVARANDIIESAPKYATTSPTPENAAKLKKIVAQAHYLRGFAYFNLVRLWGEESYAVDSTRNAVPLILKVATSRAEMMTPRASVGRVYKQVIKDLEAAEAELPETWDASNVARINKFGVKGLLGKVYLYMEDYTKSKQYFDEVLASNKYSLVPFNRYDDLFQGKNEFSSESLWELNYTVDMQQNIWENGLGSGIALVLAPPGRGWSNCTPHGVNIFRFKSDPRLKIATYAPTDSAVDVNGALTQCTKSLFNKTGHSFRKYVPKAYCVYSTNRNSGANYHMMRLADVYLMYAEVMNNLNNDVVASEFMNKVRRRAYGKDPNSAQPTVDYTGLVGTQLRDSIREERFRELFAEGHRWHDIVRWKIVEQEVSKYNTMNVTQGPIVYQPRDYYYPIPLQELDNNKNAVPSKDY